MTGYTTGETTVHKTIAGIAQVTRALRKIGRPVVLVPTMGALHQGYLELVQAAKTLPRAVMVVSAFVNPLQSGEGGDFNAYSRTLEKDVGKLCAVGVELVFAPNAGEMYPNDFRTTIQPGPLASELEGITRPGHFIGTLTVVNKLFNITNCTDTVFGEKDYQQLCLMQQMITDLNMSVQLHGVSMIREADGLAMSSRDRYLSEEQRNLAVTLSAALTAGALVADRGADAVLETARGVLASQPEVELDYLELRDAVLAPLSDEALRGDSQETEARLLVVAKVGTTRFVDNVGLILGAPRPDSVNGFGRLDQRDTEIALAALSVARLDGELTEEEAAELAELQEKVHAARDARLKGGSSRETLKNAGFGVEQDSEQDGSQKQFLVAGELSYYSVSTNNLPR